MSHNPSLHETMRLVNILKLAGWKRRQRNGVVFYLAPNGVEARSLSKAAFIIGHMGPVPTWKCCGNEVGPHILHRPLARKKVKNKSRLSVRKPF